MRRSAGRLGQMKWLALFAAFACSEGGPTTPGPTPGISIAIVPATVEVTQGSTAAGTITLTRSGGFTGAVTLTVEGLPAGVTGAFSSSTIAAGSTSATLTLTAAAAAAVASATATVRATGAGVSQATATFSATVRAAGGATPAFTLALSSGAVSVVQGTNGSVTANIGRTGGFAGAVALTVTGAPAGLTVTLDPASVAGTTSTITVAAAAGLATGTYNLTVRGTGTGVTDQTAALSVTVTPSAPPVGGNVTWTFCGSSGLPLLVAAQNGVGAWTRVTSATNSFAFQIDGRGGIAYVVPMSGGGFDIEVFYGTQAELVAMGTALCSGAAGAGVTVNGTITGAAGTDLLLIAMARSVGTVGGSNTTFSIPGVPAGSFDLVAGRSVLTISGASVTFTPNRFFIRRNVSSASSPAIELAGADGFDPVQRTLTVNNLAGEETRTLMSYWTSNTRGNLYVDAMAAAGAGRPMFTVPAARQAAGDLHYLNVIATAAGVLQPTATRNVGLAFNAGTDRSVTLGPALTAPTVTSLGGGRLRSVYTVQAEYNKLFNADFQQTGGTPRRVMIQMTGGYNSSGASATLEVPDLSGVSGWNADWLLKVGTSTTWTFASSGWTTGTAIGSIVDGESYLAATRMGTITP